MNNKNKKTEKTDLIEPNIIAAIKYLEKAISALNPKPEGPIEPLFTVLAAERALGRRLWALIIDHVIPGPTRTYPGKSRLMYNADDLSELRRILADQPDTGSKSGDRAARRRERGFYSISDVARMVGVGAVTIHYHITAGRFDAPSHKLVGYPTPFYAKTETDAIVELLRKRDGFRCKPVRGHKNKNKKLIFEKHVEK